MAQNINKDSDEDNFVRYKLKRQKNRRQIQIYWKENLRIFLFL